MRERKVIKKNNFLLTHMLIKNEPDEAEMDGTQYQEKAQWTHMSRVQDTLFKFQKGKLPYEHQAYLKK